MVIDGCAQGARGASVAAKTVARFYEPYVGTILMAVNPSDNLGAAIGVGLGGRLFDLSGGYALISATAIISSFLATGCMWLDGCNRRFLVNFSLSLL